MNKKIQFLITRYKIILGLGENDEVWYSSAQNLENNLKSRGIILPGPLFYRYNLPNNLSAQDYLYKKNMLEDFARYKSGEFERLVSCLHDKEELKQEYLSLSEKEKNMIDNYFVNKAKDANKKIVEECKKIRELNPELYGMNVSNDIEFLSGVVYGFAPAEIKHFCNLNSQNLDWKQNKEELQKQKDLEQQIGVNITYRLAPETIEDIRICLQQIQQIENAQKNNGQEL